MTTTGAAGPLAWAMVGIGTAVNLAFLTWALARRPPLNLDFRGIFSFVQFARLHAATLYQPRPLQEFQQQLYPGFLSFFPFQYPPCFLLAVGWLAHFGFAAALALWTLAGTLCLALAGLCFPPGERAFAALALLASPAALLNGAAGETGFFTCFLLLAGCRLLPRRPLAAGALFGLLVCKPQLALLVPCALAGHGAARALAGAALVALGMAAASAVFYPAALWPEWLHHLAVTQAQYLAAGAELDRFTLVTPAGNLLALGAPSGTALLLQAAASTACGIAVYRLFRCGPYRLAAAALLAGTCLAAPHAYAYDALPAVAAALLLPGGLCRPLAALVYLAPYLLLTPADRWFLYAPVQALLFIRIIWLANAAAARPDKGHEPIPAKPSGTFGAR